MSITSTVEYTGNLRTKCIHIQSKSVVETDAPTDNNGKGELFSPTDLVATSLASCMLTVMGIKANDSKISFDKIRTEVTKVMVSNPRRIASIQVDFFINELWSIKDKRIMENTARTCPVAKSLSSDLELKVQFYYSTESID